MSKLLRKSQFWYMDFILAVAFFTIILVLAFRYITSDYLLQGTYTSRVIAEADKLSESLMTSGIPLNWTNESVVLIGISPDNILDITKLDQFKNMTYDNYHRTKFLLGLQSDFLIYFENTTGAQINITNQTYIGKPGETDATVETSGPSDIVKITRYLVYRHDNIAEIIAMKVMVWQG